eukprot:7279827-Prymnesium_polylepis.1
MDFHSNVAKPALFRRSAHACAFGGSSAGALVASRSTAASIISRFGYDWARGSPPSWHRRDNFFWTISDGRWPMLSPKAVS